MSEKFNEHCERCHRDRILRDEYVAERVDVWKTARELIRSLDKSETPGAEHVLVLAEFLLGDEG